MQLQSPDDFFLAQTVLTLAGSFNPKELQLLDSLVESDQLANDARPPGGDCPREPRPQVDMRHHGADGIWHVASGAEPGLALTQMDELAAARLGVTLATPIAWLGSTLHAATATAWGSVVFGRQMKQRWLSVRVTTPHDSKFVMATIWKACAFRQPCVCEIRAVCRIRSCIEYEVCMRPTVSRQQEVEIHDMLQGALANPPDGMIVVCDRVPDRRVRVYDLGAFNSEAKAQLAIRVATSMRSRPGTYFDAATGTATEFNFTKQFGGDVMRRLMQLLVECAYAALSPNEIIKWGRE
jgi:hypothetical protein